MRDSVKKMLAICERLEGKLPEGWGYFTPSGQPYASEELDNYILLTRGLRTSKSTHFGVPLVLNLDDQDRAVQIALHAAWGQEEMGFEEFYDRGEA